MKVCIKTEAVDSANVIKSLMSDMTQSLCLNIYIQ